MSALTWPEKPAASVSGGSSLLSPGELLCSRFRIVRFVAQGGMGEVYEAEDLRLNERVALKTVRPEIAADPHSMERFHREVQLARRVTHPNVCRVFDIFQHEPEPAMKARSERGPRTVTFLAMEFLPGETLEEAIRAAGRLSVEEARPIALQIASALAAAHEAGIVHRDLKSANVVLTPVPHALLNGSHAQHRLRAVVTDFGLARVLDSGESGSERMTMKGLVVGTPAYMAPEQAKGLDVTPAADVYALGVVLHEMVTGSLPQTGDSPMTILLKRMTEPAHSPRLAVPDLDPLWEAVILRCLEIDPEKRFQAASDVARALHEKRAISNSATTVSIPRWRGRQRRFLFALAGLAAGLAAVLGIVFWLRMERPGSFALGSKGRRSIAVLGFKNLSGRTDAAWLSTALSETLTSELAAGGALRTVPGEVVARMKADLSLPDVAALAPSTLEKVRSNIGVDLLVTGSYLAAGKDAGGQLRLDIQLQDAVTGETLGSLTETGTQTGILDLVTHCGMGLRQKLGLKENAGSDASKEYLLPANPEAARLYAEGLSTLRSFDALRARELLERAVAAGPDSPLARSALADALAALGYDARAAAEARTAFELAKGLPREQRLFVEGRDREAARDWPKAIEIYRTLWEFFPDNVEYGLRLVRALAVAGEGKEALLALEEIRRLPAPVSGDPRIDLAEADVAVALGDPKKAQASAARAVKKSSTRGARLLEARAHLAEGEALRDLGALDEAFSALQAARQIFTGARDLVGAGRALVGAGAVLYYRGEYLRSLVIAKEALEVFREAGDRSGTERAMTLIGIVLSDQGHIEEAVSWHRQSLAVARETGNREREANALNNLGVELSLLGQVQEARASFEANKVISAESNNRNGMLYATHNMGALLFEEGNLAEAQKLFEEGLALAVELGVKRIEGAARLSIGGVAVERADFEGARKYYEQAHALCEGDASLITDTEIAQAELALFEKQHPEAEKLARQIIRRLESQRDSDELWAEAILAESLLGQGRVIDALAPSGRLAEQIATSEHRLVAIRAAIAVARVESESGQVGTAVKRLEEVLRETAAKNLLRLRFETRLALGEIELKSGRQEPGRSRLLALQKEAAARNFIRVSSRASALAGSPPRPQSNSISR